MGRKRQAGVKRTASGRKSRAQDVYQEHLDPIETRMRLFGLTKEQAHNQKAETVIGRWCLLGLITEDQYLASQQYLSLREAFKRAIKAPDALRTGTGGGSPVENPKYATWCLDAIKRYDAARMAVSRARHSYPYRPDLSMALQALDHVVGQNVNARSLLEDVVLALSALVHHFSGIRSSALTITMKQHNFARNAISRLMSDGGSD